ncbi:MAG: hypothetical protein JO326_14475 [Acetobacteraceae bacterium]|nr:hypothetical protein [Acetobacteraceae bacterium]
MQEGNAAACGWPALGWTVHDVAPDLALRVERAAPALSPGLGREVERLWQAAQRRAEGALFNGRVFSADAIAPDLLRGHWTEFRRLVAQMDRPDLFADLRLRSVAINGVTQGPDGIVWGRRPARAIYQPGLWQSAPAGSIDPGAAGPDGTIDIARQVQTELAEELGIAAGEAEIGPPLALVEHAGSHVCDLGVPVRVALGEAEIRRRHRAAPDKEYPALRIVPPAAIAAFVRAERAAMAPQALVFLARLGLLKSPS